MCTAECSFFALCDTTARAHAHTSITRTIGEESALCDATEVDNGEDVLGGAREDDGVGVDWGNDIGSVDHDSKVIGGHLHETIGHSGEYTSNGRGMCEHESVDMLVCICLFVCLSVGVPVLWCVCSHAVDVLAILRHECSCVDVACFCATCKSTAPITWNEAPHTDI